MIRGVTSVVKNDVGQSVTSSMELSGFDPFGSAEFIELSQEAAVSN